MNLSKGLTNLLSRVKEAINPTPQMPEWMQPDARTPRWADDEKRFRGNQVSGGASGAGGAATPPSAGTTLKDKLAPEGYQDKDGFHLGKVPPHKQGAPDIE
jgi:hypothetical protein